MSNNLRRWPLFGFDGPTSLYRHLTKSGVVISQRTLEYYAAGRRVPQLGVVATIRTALNLTPEEEVALDLDLQALATDPAVPIRRAKGAQARP